MSRRLIVEADGGSRGNPGPAGYGAVVRDADSGEVLAEVAADLGVATNNVAEYSGLIAGLRAAADLDPGEVEVRMDSKLVVEQMSGRWQIKHPDMRQLAREAAALVRTFPRVSFRHVPRELNAHADRLANAAMDAAARGEKWTRATASAGDVPPPTAVSSRDGAAGSGWLVADTAPTSMVLVRHAQTELTAERRFSGSGDPELTDVGVSESIAIADGLASSGREVSAVVTSPLRRARQTAEAIGQALGVQIDVDDGLRETDFGQWEGHTFAEVQAKWPSELEDWLTSPDVAPPGGESFAATARRVRRARDRLISAYGGQTLVVVTHVTPIKLLVRLALEAPPQALYRMHLDPASVSEIDWYADGPGLLRRLNDTSHLR